MALSLSGEVNSLRGIQGEFDSVKSQYKSRITEAESKIDRIATDISAGFEMRDKECQVLFFPKERKKRFWLQDQDPIKDQPILVEEMTKDDFQTDLLQTEGKFGHRAEIVLFPQAGADSGILQIGEQGGKWFTAMRVKIGRDSIDERLNPEASSTKHRYDAVKAGAKRFATWLVEKLGKDKAKGFEEGLEKAVLAEKDKVE